MTDLNYTALATMLSWVRSLVSWCWRLFTQGTADGPLVWISRHWLLLTVILCLAGLGIDLTVYLLRWRPLQVWRSFFLRLGDRRHPADMEMQEEDLTPYPEAPARSVRTRLKERLKAVAGDDGLDEDTRLAIYRPTMKTDRSENFRAPVYPTAQPEDKPAHALKAQRPDLSDQ